MRHLAVYPAAPSAVRSGPSGSAIGYARHAQGRVAVRERLPNGRERTESERSGPSGSALGYARHARGRVAVQITLPLAGERTGLRAQGRVAVRVGMTLDLQTWRRRRGVSRASLGDGPLPRAIRTGCISAGRTVSWLVKSICSASFELSLLSSYRHVRAHAHRAQGTRSRAGPSWRGRTMRRPRCQSAPSRWGTAARRARRR